jgi:hypothetical protein
MHYQAVSAIGTDDALAKLRETGKDTNSPAPAGPGVADV